MLKAAWPSPLASYDRALAIAPDHAQAHLSRAMAWLQMGDFAGLARV